MRRMVLCLAGLLAVFGWTIPGRAEINTGNSAEWLAVESELIALATPVEFTPTDKAEPLIGYSRTRFKLNQVLKGPLSAGDTVTILNRDRQLDERLQKEIASKSPAEALIFVQSMDSPDAVGVVSPDKKDTWRIEAKAQYVFAGQPRPAAYFPGQGVEDVYTDEFQLVTKFDDLLQRTALHCQGERQLKAQSPTGKIERLWLEVPMDSPAFAKLFGGSTCYVSVPADRKYLDRYLKAARSGQWYEREEAIAELRNFRDERIEPLLRELLKDDFENPMEFSNHPDAPIRYSIRTAAAATLAVLGKPVPDIPLERKATEEDALRYSSDYWTKSFNQGLAGGWKVTSFGWGVAEVIDHKLTQQFVITLGQDEKRCELILTPAEWPRPDFSAAVVLGLSRGGKPGGRWFSLRGQLPEEVRKKLTDHFGLGDTGSVKK